MRSRTYTRTQTHTHTHAHIHSSTWSYEITCMHTQECSNIYTHTNINTQPNAYVHADTYAQALKYACVFANALTHTHIHTLSQNIYLNTHTYSCLYILTLTHTRALINARSHLNITYGCFWCWWYSLECVLDYVQLYNFVAARLCNNYFQEIIWGVEWPSLSLGSFIVRWMYLDQYTNQPYLCAWHWNT